MPAVPAMDPQPVRRHVKQGPPAPWALLRPLARLWVLTLLLALGWVQPALAQGVSGGQLPPVELATLQVERSDGALNLEFGVRINLPRTVEDALHRGIPLYFVAEAQLKRSRWYWRDERVARISRSWRIAYQPLTNTWRVGLGGLNQTHATLADSLAAVSRSAGWKLADLSQLDPDGSYYVEFSFRLDTSQLPGPMQFGLGGQGDWAVGASRVLKIEPTP